MLGLEGGCTWEILRERGEVTSRRQRFRRCCSQDATFVSVADMIIAFGNCCLPHFEGGGRSPSLCILSTHSITRHRYRGPLKVFTAETDTAGSLVSFLGLQECALLLDEGAPVPSVRLGLSEGKGYVSTLRQEALPE